MKRPWTWFLVGLNFISSFYTHSVYCVQVLYVLCLSALCVVSKCSMCCVQVLYVLCCPAYHDVTRYEMICTRRSMHLGASPGKYVLTRHTAFCGPPSQTRCPVVWEWEKRPGYWRTLMLDEVARLEDSFQDYVKATEKQPIDKELAAKFRSQTIDLQGSDWTVSSSLLGHVL